MRLNEFSNKKLSQYKTAAAADATKADAAGDFARGHKRFKGINAATKKQFDNDAKLAKLKEQGVAEGVDSENNPWHVTDVDAVSETDFEVALQGPAGIKLNFVIRPVDFVETQRERYQIDSMDVRDLQSGKTMHWGSMQNLGKWEPIFDAIDEHFWMDRSLQAHLAKIVDYYMDAGEHGKNPDMMSDLDKRDPNGIAVSAKDFVASHNQADAAIKSAKEGVAEDQLDELSKDTIRNYVRAQPARIKGPAGLATTDNKKAARIVDPVKGDIRRAMDKYKDPEYGQQRPRLPEDSLAAMRRLAGVTTPAPVVPNGQRQYRHMPTAVQPR